MGIVKETGKPVARDLGINPYRLHNWVRADHEPEAAGEALSESEREEPAQLCWQKAERTKEH